MKKLSLLLMVILLLFAGCQPAQDKSETPVVEQIEEEVSLSSPQSQVEITPSVTDDALQFDSTGLLFGFSVRKGTFTRGGNFILDLSLTNNNDTSYILFYDFDADAKLVCRTNDKEYVIFPRNDNSNAYNDILSMEMLPGTRTFCRRSFDIPVDAPLGEYTLECSYRGTTTLFEGYFTLTQ